MTEKANANPIGRPTLYTPELGEKICIAVATTTHGLRKMCKLHPEFPNVDTIFTWRYKHPAFAEQYAQAKRHQADLLAEDILDISDNDALDIGEVQENGKPLWNSEAINRSRLRVDTRKWIACKLIPKLYGDKVTHEGNVQLTPEQSLKEIITK